MQAFHPVHQRLTYKYQSGCIFIYKCTSQLISWLMFYNENIIINHKKTVV